MHEENDVAFHVERKVARIDEGSVELDDGTTLEVELVLVGIGVESETGLAAAAGLEVGDGVVVDERLRTSAVGAWAAGDVARCPEPRSGRRVRVEHWVHARRTGQTAARSILGVDGSHTQALFFWTNQFDVKISFVGHAPEWDEAEEEGDPAGDNGVVRLKANGRELAVIGVGPGAETLEAEVQWRDERAEGSPLHPASRRSASSTCWTRQRNWPHGTDLLGARPAPSRSSRGHTATLGH